jgi:hypothetical protein
MNELALIAKVAEDDCACHEVLCGFQENGFPVYATLENKLAWLNEVSGGPLVGGPGRPGHGAGCTIAFLGARAPLEHPPPAG